MFHLRRVQDFIGGQRLHHRRRRHHLPGMRQAEAHVNIDSTIPIVAVAAAAVVKNNYILINNITLSYRRRRGRHRHEYRSTFCIT